MYYIDYISNEFFYQFIDPKKRIFIGYLFLAILIALFWLKIFKKYNYRDSLIKLFDKNIFWSKSAISDYKLLFINKFIMIFVSPYLITQITIATSLFYFFHSVSWLSAGMFNNISVFTVMFMFTIFNFILDDFSKFIVHRWMHKWKILWAIHKVHHSATKLTPLTVFRVHPLEGIVFSLRSSIVQAITISSFLFFFGNKVDLITILGANIFNFFFNVLGSNLRHSHIEIRYWWWLEYVLISPAQHQLHHSISKKHYDKNFGVAFAFWDWMFGSLHHSEENDTLKLGLSEKDENSIHSLKSLYLGPIYEIFQIFKNYIKHIYKINNYIKTIFLRRLIRD